MPKSKFINHKGRNRRFTNPEELEQERKKDELKKWRKHRGEEESESSDIEEENDSENSNSEEETSSEDEDNSKAKGVSKLIDIENPNRVQKKTKKLTVNTKTDELVDKPELSRREREELAKQRSQAHYQKLHAEGKTEQARADLARLAVIKQQREEAQKRREIEKKMKEDAAKQKTALTQKALGKK